MPDGDKTTTEPTARVNNVTHTMNPKKVPNRIRCQSQASAKSTHPENSATEHATTRRVTRPLPQNVVRNDLDPRLFFFATI
jgi:hypothetical protein